MQIPKAHACHMAQGAKDHAYHTRLSLLQNPNLCAAGDGLKLCLCMYAADCFDDVGEAVWCADDQLSSAYTLEVRKLRYCDDLWIMPWGLGSLFWFEGELVMLQRG